MTSAVLIINATDRVIFEGADCCHIRVKYRDLAKRFMKARVVLYQSGLRGDIAGGYIGTAIIENVFDRPDDLTRCVVILGGYDPFDRPRPLLTEEGGMFEPGLINPHGRLKGWKAAEDIREISTDSFYRIIDGEVPAQQPFEWRQDESEQLAVPLFSSRDMSVRDPLFARGVYLAYGGLCAISKVPMLGGYRDSCGLIAAHLYPYHLEMRNSVSSGMLFAPSWHSRYDNGQILLHDDYTWTAVVEDSDTLAITDRRLHLPSVKGDLPDVQLIRRNRLRMQNLNAAR